MMRRACAALMAMALLLALPVCSGGGSEDYRLTAYFDKTVSLYKQSAVKVLGLPAGHVKTVDVQGNRVKVEMTISRDIPIPADVRATIVPLSLIGERYIQLFPAWTEGQPRAKNGAVIPRERTSIPVEPDEALAAVKKFLDTLDPDATGRLVKNLADDLEGNGQALNDALKGIANLTTTFAEKDDELASIIEHFDEFSATLRTREQQLGKVLDGFATTTALLAAERRQIELLVGSLAQLSSVGLDLVSEHGARLDKDITILTRVLRSVDTNLDRVVQLLDAGPVLVAGRDLDGRDEGLLAAYDPKYHRLDLRTATSPTVGLILQALGLATLPVCLPVDVSCTPPSSGAAAAAACAPLPNAAPGARAQAPGPPTTTPIDSVVGLLGSPTTVAASSSAATAPKPARASWLARAARSLIGVIG